MRGWETGPDPKPIQKDPICNLRDIKMLLRLALRISTFHGSGITVETFRRCAMFRNVEIAPETDLV